MGPARQTRIRIATALERALGLVGLACVAWYGAACAHDSWQSRVTDARFERAVERALVADHADQSAWSASRRERFAERLAADDDELDALGRLEIPTGGVSVAVLEGTGDDVLDRAAGRIEGTARPGAAGNLGIAGHRDGHFRGLRDVAVGDPIYLARRSGIDEYRIVDLSVVDPEQVEVLDPTREPTLTLVTCFPFVYLGKAPQRFIVRAERAAVHAWRPDEPVDQQLAALRVEPHSS